MNELIPFDFQGNNVRVVLVDDEPHFVAKDVATVLGYAEPSSAIRQHCRGGAKYTPIIDSLGRTQEARVIPESDLMRLIVSSKLPAAQEFERKVFEDILPQIRKTGSYGQVQRLEGPALLAAAVLEAQAMIQSQEKQIEAADKYIADNQPKIDYVDLYVTDDDLLTIRQVAKSLGVQETIVREALLEHDWIYCETASRWSEKDQSKVIQRRYSPKSHKRDYFRTVQRHEAPRFKGQVDHTLKITAPGAKAIGQALKKWGLLENQLNEVAS
ncbi:BRO family protein [Actinomycetaceae bacterium MB13-C1-2]|nr:BRO family protein [Actinomycetaceae bacterium MB13-C1-2]